MTRSTGYAVRAILELAQKRGEFISSRQISKSQRIPYQFLRRILQELIGHELVLSKGGRSGGFKVARNPDLITVVDVMNIFQGEIQLSDCMFRNKPCVHRSNCVLRKRIVKIDEKVKNEFKNISIGGLLKDLKKQKGGL
ncbi:MAG: Rrf2 family transcriptional regulator [Elusimicrobiota bacterium]|nr:Rrf2 family transcriptional regulator [Elusimicrobiota bacterium]